MSTISAESGRRFYRDADRAMLGGVCAGLAAYLGFNLRVTRVLAFIAFLMAMPLAVIAYLAAVFLIPSVSRVDTYEAKEPPLSRKQRRRHAKQQAAAAQVSARVEIDRRCQTLNERLARLEKHVTSRRFQLEQELSRL